MASKPGFEFRIFTFVILLGLVVIVTGIFTFRNLTNVISDVKKSATRDELVSLSRQVRYKLYNVESNVRTFYLSRDSNLIAGIELLNHDVNADLDSMQSVALSGTPQQMLADSIRMIADRKFELMRQWMKLAPVATVTGELKTITQRIDTISAQQPDLSQLSDAEKYLKLQEQGKIDPTEISREIDLARIRQTSGLSRINQEELALNIQTKQVNLILDGLIADLERMEQVAATRQAGEATGTAKFTNIIIAVFCITSLLLLAVLTIAFYRYLKATRAYQAALKKARTEAEQLAAAKQNFLATMTHEIRTPLNSIVGFTEQLLKSSTSAGQSDQLQIIRNSSEHLLKIVNEVLDYSKLQTGKFIFEDLPFDPVEKINEVVEIMIPTAGKKNVSLDWLANSDLPKQLSGDSFRLQQVLLNIVGNAIKFTNSGGIQILVNGHSAPDNTFLLNFDVTDTGIGIPENKVDKIFEEYEQVDGSISKVYGGSGLGLNITKKIIEQQGGKISIRSKINSGTTVSFSIPYKVASDMKAPAKESAPVYKAEFLAGKNVLIADDEPYNRMLLRAILDKYKVSVSEAENGKVAYEQIVSSTFDVALIDLRMPELDGYELIRMIRSSNQRHIAALPLIVLSAANSDDERRECIDAGADLCLAKPFKENELIEMLQQLLPLKNKNGNGTAISGNFNNLKHTKHLTMDVTELIAISNGDKNFVNEMLKLFIKGTNEGIQLIRKGYEEGNVQLVIEQAHKISSPCKHVGADKLYLLLKSIESEGRDSMSLDKLLPLIEKAEAEVESVIKEAEGLLPRTA